jgi:hypothetical protein
MNHATARREVAAAPTRTAGAIKGISLAYVPGIGMERLEARSVTPAKPKLERKATRCIAVIRAFADGWERSRLTRSRTRLNDSGFDQVLDILRGHGLVESRKAKVGKEHRLTQAGLREQAHWLAEWRARE